MSNSSEVFFRNQAYQDYKAFFLAYFSDQQKFNIEVNLAGHLEHIIIKSTDKLIFLRLEIILLIDNGAYQHVLDIRYKHPHSPGFTRLQNENRKGLGDQFRGFSVEKLTALVALMEERLQLGWEEYRYFKADRYYKSKVILPSPNRPRVMVYRKEQKGLGYLLLSALIGKWYRKLNREIRVERKVITVNWL